MTEQKRDIDQNLLQLIISLQAGAMQQMGKVANPMTGQVERDLELCRHTIGMVEMLKNKMTGNLTDDESKLLEHILYELKMNYVEESKKPVEPTPAENEKTDAEETKKSDEAKSE